MFEDCFETFLITFTSGCLDTWTGKVGGVVRIGGGGERVSLGGPYAARADGLVTSRPTRANDSAVL